MVRDDRCHFFSYGSRCPFRKIKKSKHFCEIHATCDVKKSIQFDCCICIETKDKKDIKFFSCSHFVCKDCFKKLRDTLCPICRKPLDSVLTTRMKEEIERRNLRDKTDRNNAAFREYIENNNDIEVVNIPVIPIFDNRENMLGYMVDVIDDVFINIANLLA